MVFGSSSLQVGLMVLRSSRRVLALLVTTALSLLPLSLWAQAAAPPPNQSTYTFRADTHIVLTDVTVTDAKGNPVHGLPQSAFHIFDNKKPQEIASFEEHATIPADMSGPAIASASGVYSNDYLLHLPPVLNIVLIDIARLDMADEMYLNYELTKFLNERPDGQPLAIYLRAGSGCFLVQNFTSDRKLLLDALHKAIPRFPPQDSEYLSDFDTLQQMALALSQLPGRKNLLWFSGGSFVPTLMPDAVYLQNDAAWRTLYDELDQERIAIYPIDARGLMVILRPNVLMVLATQHIIMNEQAQATGGQAFYDNNGLKEETEHLLDTDVSFYTLTYSPKNLRFDNKWHKIRVTVDGSYHLSYRSGYFADGSMRDKEEPPKARTRLLADGGKLEEIEQKDKPIIFRAKVLPSSDPSVANWEKPSGSLAPPPAKKGSVPFSVRYTVPLNALTVREVEGKHQVVFAVAAIALNRDGSAVRHDAQQVTMVLKEDVFRRDPDLIVTLDQKVNLTKDDQFLNLGVLDTVSGRFGSIEVPLDVHKPAKH
jgi:VWFA-related protein